jgi:hypothetical protein
MAAIDKYNDPDAPVIVSPASGRSETPVTVTTEWKDNSLADSFAVSGVAYAVRNLPDGPWLWWYKDGGGTSSGGSETFSTAADIETVDKYTFELPIGIGSGQTIEIRTAIQYADSEGTVVATTGYSDSIYLEEATAPAVEILHPVANMWQGMGDNVTVLWRRTDLDTNDVGMHDRYRIVVYENTAGGTIYSDTGWIEKFGATRHRYIDLPAIPFFNPVIRVYVSADGVIGYDDTAALAVDQYRFTMASEVLATVDESAGGVRLQANTRFNLVPYYQASMSGPSSDWTKTADTTSSGATLVYGVDISEGPTYTGDVPVVSEDMTLQCYATAGEAGFATVLLGQEMPVDVGRTYVLTFVCAHDAASAANTVYPRIEFYESDGSLAASASTDSQAILQQSWTEVTMTATAPADAAYAKVGTQMAFRAQTPGHTWYFSDWQFYDNGVDSPLGSKTAIPTGGDGGFIVERQDGDDWVYVTGYSEDSPGPSADQYRLRLDVIDRAAPMGTGETITYRVTALGHDSEVPGEANKSYVGPKSFVSTTYLIGDSWWVRSCVDPSLDMKVAQVVSRKNFTVDAETLYPINRDAAVVVSSNRAKAEEITLQIIVETEADLENLTTMLKSDQPLIIQSPTAGEVWYARITGTVSYSQIMSPSSLATRTFRPVFQISASAVEIEPPTIRITRDYATDTDTYEVI